MAEITRFNKRIAVRSGSEGNVNNLFRIFFALSLAGATCTSSSWAQSQTKPRPQPAAKKPQEAARQNIPIVIRVTEAQQTDAVLVLGVSWTFKGSQGAFTQPSVDVIDPGSGSVIERGYSKLTGTSGIATSATAPVTLPFSAMYRKQGEPLRVYFKIEKGDLQLWWPAQPKPAGKNPIMVQLGRSWLASSADRQPTADHAGGGLLISAPQPDGKPLEFYVDFTEAKTLMPGPSVKNMGTE